MFGLMDTILDVRYELSVMYTVWVVLNFDRSCSLELWSIRRLSWANELTSANQVR